MLKVFLASHAHLASGMASSLALFENPGDRLQIHDAYVDGEEAGLKESLDAFLASLSPDDEALLLSDLYGGSVNTVMAGYLDRPHTRLVAGVNLAFLIEVMSAVELDDNELDRIIDQARSMLREVRLDTQSDEPANSPDDFF